jgi:hypothetical protein
MARGAVRPFDFGPGHDQLAMLAFEKFRLRRGMASAAERGNFVRRGDPVRRRGAGGGTVLHAGSVTGVATQSFLEVLVGQEIGDLLGVARGAEFMRLLSEERERE